MKRHWCHNLQFWLRNGLKLPRGQTYIFGVLSNQTGVHRVGEQRESPWLWLLVLVTYDRWHATCHTWHVTWDMWHMIHVTWHMTYDSWYATDNLVLFCTAQTCAELWKAIIFKRKKQSYVREAPEKNASFIWVFSNPGPTPHPPENLKFWGTFP